MKIAYSGQLHELTYDPSNRLIRVQELGYSDVTDYRISASGWRYWSKAGTANAIYSPRDGSSPLGEFTVGSFPFSWTLRRPDGSVYGRKAYNSSNEFFWTDHLGSVRVRTSNSGSMLEAHDYYPFGLDMPGRSSTGTPVRQGFTGYWRDGESGLGLYYAGARMYSPGTGRFFGVDPLSEDFATWSPYAYVMNNPIGLVDPTGKSAECLKGGCSENERFFNQDGGKAQVDGWNKADEKRADYLPTPLAAPPLAIPFIIKGATAAYAVIEAALITASAYLLAKMGYETLSQLEQNATILTVVETPLSHPEAFEPIRGTPAKRHIASGEVWVKDPSRHGGEHWEVYKNKRNFDNRKRDRQVWIDGRTGKEY